MEVRHGDDFGLCMMITMVTDVEAEVVVDRFKRNVYLHTAENTHCILC